MLNSENIVRSQYWCFTLNHPTEMFDFSLYRNVQYAIYQHEIGEEGTDHFQGYIELKRSRTLLEMKNQINYEAHWEPRRGNAAQAREYCLKEDTRILGPWIYGEQQPKKQGKRNDMAIVMDMIKEGAKDMDCLNSDYRGTYLRYRNHFMEYRHLLNAERAKDRMPIRKPEEFNRPLLDINKPIAYLIVGPTSCGKSAYARAHFKNPLMVRHIDKLKDFDETVHDGIVFDDMNFAHYPAESIIHLLDYEYETDFHARYRCAYIPPNTKKIFTSNVADIFEPKNAKNEVNCRPDQTEAINRRFELVVVTGKLYGPTEDKMEEDAPQLLPPGLEDTHPREGFYTLPSNPNYYDENYYC